jgi:FAD/FMN-containing dehydrogenase
MTMTENTCFPLPQQTSADRIKSTKTQGMPRFDRLSVLGLSAYVGNLAVSLLLAKMHFTTRARMERLYPKYEPFKKLRRQIDPAGMFLNELLRPLFL